MHNMGVNLCKQCGVANIITAVQTTVRIWHSLSCDYCLLYWVSWVVNSNYVQHGWMDGPLALTAVHQTLELRMLQQFTAELTLWVLPHLSWRPQRFRHSVSSADLCHWRSAALQTVGKLNTLDHGQGFHCVYVNLCLYMRDKIACQTRHSRKAAFMYFLSCILVYSIFSEYNFVI